MKAHPNVTRNAVMDAVDRQRNSLDNPGFCTECGHEADACEPDAQAIECEACGENSVYGAEELLFMAGA